MIPNPCPVRCDIHREDHELRRLVEDVMTWPRVEGDPLPIDAAKVFFLRVGQEFSPNGDPAVTWNVFARIVFESPTVYLKLPLNCAYWVIHRGWAKHHSSSGFDLVTPDELVVYPPRDETESAVCRSLLWVSYNLRLQEGRKNVANGKIPYSQTLKSSVAQLVATAG